MKKWMIALALAAGMMMAACMAQAEDVRTYTGIVSWATYLTREEFAALGADELPANTMGYPDVDDARVVAVNIIDVAPGSDMVDGWFHMLIPEGGPTREELWGKGVTVTLPEKLEGTDGDWLRVVEPVTLDIAGQMTYVTIVSCDAEGMTVEPIDPEAECPEWLAVSPETNYGNNAGAGEDGLGMYPGMTADVVYDADGVVWVCWGTNG